MTQHQHHYESEHTPIQFLKYKLYLESKNIFSHYNTGHHIYLPPLSPTPLSLSCKKSQYSLREIICDCWCMHFPCTHLDECCTAAAYGHWDRLKFP